MNKTLIIAEAGVNHNGSIELAYQLIEEAKAAGADIVKFQSFKADKLATASAPKAAYQKQTTLSEESQLEMLKRLELSESMHEKLISHCEKIGIQFLSTPFDLEGLELLTQKFGLGLIKIPSGEITNGPLLLKAGQTKKKLILSTGMATLGDVETALSILAFGFLGIQNKPSIENFREAYCSEEGQQYLQENVQLLHCTTQYPTPFDDVNLNAMATLRQAFDLPVGLSDHTAGIYIPLAAAALGACVIEKHFTLDRTLEGPDHRASIEPLELKEMVSGIRAIELALGHGVKRTGYSEYQNMAIARKSIVASLDIRQGEDFSNENITLKRPGTGISPIYYWDYIGKTAAKDYKEGELIQ